MRKAILAAFLLLATVSAGAQSSLPLLQVAPWNGHKAAVSLTFDDSDPSHLDVAIPELNQRGLHGTFFLIVNRTDRKDEWRKAMERGHELGNHTLDHEHPNVLTPDQAESQVEGAQAVLQKTFGIPIYSFAYPYTEITPDLHKWVEQTSFIARGGYGDGNYYMKSESEPDWLNIPSQMTQTDTPFITYQNWLDRDFQSGAWMVFMIHGLEGTLSGYQPISKKIFGQILDALQARDFWVETFSGVGAYWKAEKIFEKTPSSESGNQRQWTWVLPKNFPVGVILKLKIEKKSESPSVELSQKGRVIPPDGLGYYAVSMDAQELTERLSPSR